MNLQFYVKYKGEKKKICLVPVTRPYLIFWPDPKLFPFEHKNFWSIFFTQ